MTPQRMAVLKVLINNSEHPTIEQIHALVRRDFPMTSLATVYKTVNLLKEMGEILELDLNGERKRYDGHNPNPHQHLVCVKCGHIVDLEIATLDELSQEVSQTTGYRIIKHQLDFFGICPECQTDE
jgi:Fur family peroxide stress response transcriptional regulator